MGSLYFVESPFQVINALEAASYFKDTDGVVIIRRSSESENNVQMDRLLEKWKWRSVLNIPYHQNYFITGLKALWMAKQMARMKCAFERAFQGIFGSGCQNLVVGNTSFRELYHLDDGAYTFEVQENFLQYKNPYPQPESALKNLFLKSLGLKTTITKPVNLFTCFRINPGPNQKIIRHNFEFLKSLFPTPREHTDEKILFIGGNWVEFDYLKKDFYFNYLLGVRRMFGDKKIVYIAHRREDERNLESYARIPGFSIVKYKHPLEYEFLAQGIRPSRIVGPYSTVFFTLTQIFKKLPITLLDFPDEEVSLSGRSRIQHFRRLFAEQLETEPVRVELPPGNE